MSLDDIKKNNKTHNDLVAKVIDLESRLRRLEVENAVMKRVICFEIHTNEADGKNYVTCARKQSFTTITDDERRILERKEGE